MASGAKVAVGIMVLATLAVTVFMVGRMSTAPVASSGPAIQTALPLRTEVKVAGAEPAKQSEPLPCLPIPGCHELDNGGLAQAEEPACIRQECPISPCFFNDTASEFSYHTYDCGLAVSQEWTRRACLSHRYVPLPSSPTLFELVLTSTVVEERGVQIDARPACGDHYRLLMRAEADGIFFAASVAERPDECGTYTVSMRLPPLLTVLSFELRLLHIDGQGVAEPDFSESPPQTYNIAFVAESGGALHVRAVDADVVYDSEAPGTADSKKKLFTAGRQCTGLRTSEHSGWWLPSRTGTLENTLNADSHIDWVPAAGDCLFNHVAGQSAFELLHRRRVLFFGETFITDAGRLVQAHASTQPRLTPGLTPPGRYVWPPAWISGRLPNVRVPLSEYDGIVQEAETLAAALADLPSGDEAKNFLFKGVPRQVDVLIAGFGATDLAEGTVAAWNTSVIRFLDALSSLPWQGTLIWVTAPAVYYKNELAVAPADCVYSGGSTAACATAESALRFEPLSEIAAGDSEQSAVQTVTGRRAGSVRLAQESEVPIGGRELPHNSATEPRVRLANEVALEALRIRRPGTLIVDAHAMTDALGPDWTFNGRQWCGPDTERQVAAAASEWGLPCLGTQVLANAALGLVTNEW